MNGVAVFIGEDLDFDVARGLQKFFHVDHGIAESRPSLGLGHGDGVQQRGFGMHDAHTAAAAAAGCLDDDRVADTGGGPDDLVGIIGQGAVGAGHARHLGFEHRLFGGDLVAHQADIVGTRADEGEAGRLHALGEICIFRQETIAGMDGGGIGDFGGGDDRRHVQIALCRGRRADADRFVGQLHILGVAVGFGIHSDRLDAHFAAGALDTQGDFTAVCNQNLFKHLGSPRRNRPDGLRPLRVLASPLRCLTAAGLRGWR